MRRISEENSHIEHFKPRRLEESKKKHWDLEYANMLVCYLGTNENSGYGARQKDDSDTQILNPHDPVTDSAFRYAYDGKILGQSELARQTVDVLVLNHEELRRDRMKVLDFWRNKLRSSQATAGKCRQLLASYEGSPKLPEYYGVIRQVLSAHIEQREKKAQRINRESRG